MDDIVERLMTQARVGLMGLPDDFIIFNAVSYRQAADTITALRAERDAAYRKGAEDMRERAAAVAEAEEVLPDIPSAVTISHLTRVGAVKAAQSGGEAAKIIIAAAIRKLEPTP